jgi:hypothetical protein
MAPAIAGDLVAYLNVSEPGGGSDVAAIAAAQGRDRSRLTRTKTP